MKSHKFLIAAFILYNFLSMNAQDLTKHQWKNRIIVMMVKDYNETYKEQVTNFKGLEKDLEERKLLIYTASPGSSALGLESWEAQTGSEMYSKYRKTEAPFEMILIGLDGGVKERWTEIVDPKEIFRIIDSMPMRQSEIRSKGE